MSDSQPEQESELLKVYSVRVTERAKRDIQDALLRFAEISGETIARTWVIELYDVIATLATLPRRCPVPEETRFFPAEVRQYQYRRAGSAVAYRILFSIRDESEDGAIISILHVRHAARRPITRKEAKEIQTEK